jgi:putative oxidoreductase
MKIAVIVIRTLVGLLFLFASISFFFKLMPQPELEGDMKLYMVGLSTVNLIVIVKAIELLCGLAFVSGKFNALATVVIFPIVINIVVVHALIAPEGLPTAIILLAANLFLAYAHRESYKGLLKA